MAEKPVSVRFGVVGGDKVKAEFTAIANEGKRAFSVIEGGGRASGAALQNVGYQVQDFAVQVASGTSASRALAQQLPQLLSGFGLIGVALGTAVAIFAPFITGLLSSDDAAKQMATDLDALQKASRDYQSAMDAALQPMDTLKAKYGEQAAAMREVLTAQLALSRFEYEKALSKGAADIERTTAGLVELTDHINAAMAAASDPKQQGPALAALNAMASTLARDFGLSVDQANALKSALDELHNAKGPEEVAAATRAIWKAMEDSAGSTGHVKGALIETVKSAIDLEMQARDLAAKLGISVEQAQALADTDVGKGIRGAADSAFVLVEQIKAAKQALADRALDQSFEGASMAKWGSRAPSAAQTLGGRSLASPADQLKGYLYQDEVPKEIKHHGGGGMSAAQKEQNDQVREAKRVFDQTRTSAEKYEIEQGKLNDMLAKGAISQDTYNRAMEQLKEKTDKASQAAKALQDGFESAFVDIVTGSKSAREAIGNLLADMASLLAHEAFKSLAGSLFGGSSSILSGLFANANGNAFDGGAVQAFASGGVVSRPTLFGMRGGMGLMGEAGPEAILPLKRINGKLGVVAGGAGGDGVNVHVSINVDARGAVDGVAEQVVRAVRAEVPGIVRQAVAGVGIARRRGVDV